MRIAFPGLLTVTALFFAAAPLAAAERPNVLVVMVDDLGWADLGCYGSEIATPNLDALAADGLQFTRFYNTGKCHSSRVCLLSGQWCHKADKTRSGSGMSRAVTFGDVLGEAGYHTSMSGKWHLRGEPTDRGFDRYFGHLSGATNFFVGDETFRLDGRPWAEFDKDFYTTVADTDYAIAFISEALDEGRPFLSYVAYNAPHYPLHVPEEDFRKYERVYEAGWDAVREARFAKQKRLGLVPVDAELPPRPDVVPAWETLASDERNWEARRMAAFAGMIDRLDREFGRLVDFLKSRDAWENTLLLFCSDNGGCPFERTKRADLEPWDPESYWTYDTAWATVSNTPLKYYKQNNHEGGVSSPLIAHWPAGLRRHGLYDEPAHLVDIMPTLMELGGAPYPDADEGRPIRGHDGVSFAAALRGEEWSRDAPIFFYFGSNAALIDGDRKVVSCRGGAWELYDLATDRSERNDLAGMRPDETASLVRRYEEIWGQPFKVDADPGVPTTHQKPRRSRMKIDPQPPS
ncbi:MAG: arylsulfatase [Planctomycetota bacterium]